eukprot:gene5441-9254_t
MDLFSKNTIRLSGSKLLDLNIDACLLLSKELSTTLGPCGFDKLIVDKQNNILITNDGITILKNMNIEHPAALLLLEVSKTQDEIIGDGTTSVVLLTCELLRNAKSLLTMNIHPSTISYGYRKCLDISLDILEKESISIDLLNNKSTLKEIVKTILSSKILTISSEYFSELIVESILRLNEILNKENKKDNHNNKELIRRLNVEKVIGKSFEETELFDGILVAKKLKYKKKIENAKILISKIEFGNYQTKIFETKFKVDSHLKGEELSNFEIKKMKEICEKIKKLKINVIFNSSPISSEVEEFFNSNNILCFGNIDLRKLETLSIATETSIYNSNSLKENLNFGHAKSVETCFISDSSFIKISGCNWISIILRAPTPVILDECERSLHDSICVLNEILKSKKIIGGAGSMYIEISKRIRNEMFNYKDKMQLVLENFAISLETIPVIILQNAGFDSSLLSELRFKHQKNENIWYGIDINNGKIKNILQINEENNEIKGVIEPTKILESILTSSVDAAESILRIDENILIEPRLTPEELGLL